MSVVDQVVTLLDAGTDPLTVVVALASFFGLGQLYRRTACDYDRPT